MVDEVVKVIAWCFQLSIFDLCDQGHNQAVKLVSKSNKIRFTITIFLRALANCGVSRTMTVL